MIDIKRAILYGLLLLVIYTLWTDWQKNYPEIRQKQAVKVQHVVPTETKNFASSSDNTEDVTPPAFSDNTATSEVKHTNLSSNDSSKKEIVRFVKTDVLKLGFNVYTGDIVNAQFLKYSQSEDNKKPFVMLSNESPKKYVALTRLFSLNNDSLSNVKVNFSPESFHVNHYKEKGRWIVSMQGVNSEGLNIQKKFILNENNYLIDVRYSIVNESEKPIEVEWTTQFSQTNPVEDKSSLFHLGSYSGGAISMPGDKLYKKISYSDMASENLEKKVKEGWVAMQQHYFLTAWIPPVGSVNKFYTQVNNSTYIMGVLSEPVRLEPKQTHEFSSRLYIGPELMDVLKGIAPGLDLTIDYGWLSVISVFLFYILQNIYNFVGNWGWSIILVTVLIKLTFYRLSAKSYFSMANMRKLQPKLEELKQRFADDKTKMSQATMELYRKEKVNPLGGCLPIVVQIPVFIALYWVILESVQLRQAPFIFWIHDLSVADPYYILPIIMGITMLIQQKLNPPPPDPTQAKVMMFLPVIFTGLFLHFPAGLVLYWVVNNALSILQQWYITRKVSNEIIKKRFTRGKLIGKSNNKKLSHKSEK